MMEQCGFCKDPVPAFEKPRKAHLIISQDREDHVHVHGDIGKTDAMRELLLTASEEVGIPMTNGGPKVPAELVFKNRQRIGDILMFTCAVRDFKRAFPDTRVGVQSTAMHIWDNNPYVDRQLRLTQENLVNIGPGELTNASNRLDWHFANAYRVSIERALGVHIQQGESRPDIWLTQEEYDAPRVIKDPYWLIVVGGEKGWGCKMYPFDRWQSVIDENKDKLFVQLGAAGDDPPRLQGSNVIDYVGKTEDKHTGIRDLFKLFLNAEGSIGLVSFHMHLSGALYKPSVVIAGAREPVSFTRYQGHQYLANDGTLPCADTKACWHCSIDACTNLVEKPDALEKKIPRCVDMIEPWEVTRAINMYYRGGRLKTLEASRKPPIRKRSNDAGVNVVQTPTQAAIPDAPDVRKMYGLDWGGSAVTWEDFKILRDLIQGRNVRTLLEFGAGLSTLLLNELTKVTSYETEENWIQRILSIKEDLNIVRWDGKQAPELEGKYDLAFVDGPANGERREAAMALAAKHSDVVVVDDHHRAAEVRWQIKHLEGPFQGPIKVGSRCHLWIRKEAGGLSEARKWGQDCPKWTELSNSTPTPLPPPKVAQRPKTVRIVSTARGWGGQGRSVTTIMRLLQQEGHKVEFVPFRNKVSSREFKQKLEYELTSVQVRPDYSSIAEPCNTLLVYADDYVWEFSQDEIAKAFQGIQASRKVMMVNYRRGGIGEIPWTRGWDEYVFLNSGQEKDLLGALPGSKTRVLPPCTDLTEFFKVKIDYENGLRVVRHNSQGDTKFDKNVSQEVSNALSCREDLEISMMPGPSFVAEQPPRFKKYGRNNPPVPEFLALGNLFWYSLPVGYLDMGPRVILEAMAAGLPILADKWGGAVDRVTPECGWLCENKQEMIDVLKDVTSDEIRTKGEMAKKRARDEFVPERWLDILI